jgi:hypothetical protein
MSHNIIAKCQLSFLLSRMRATKLPIVDALQCSGLPQPVPRPPSLPSPAATWWSVDRPVPHFPDPGWWKAEIGQMGADEAWAQIF